MELTNEEQKTLAYYNGCAKLWASDHQDMGKVWESIFKRFQDYLPSGSIFEIGCGGGRDARVLAEMGYQYTGIDVSREFVKVARENNPELTFRAQGVYDFYLDDTPYDGFWAAASLLHIPKHRIHLALRQIRRHLKPDAVGMICMKMGEGEVSVEDAQGCRFFAYYTETEFTRILAGNHFEVLEVIIKPVTKKTTWMAFLVRNM